jgi:protocatechuate 3,4-dioxygenase beta subunit
VSGSILRSSRRGFLSALALGSAAFTVRGAFAEVLTRTPPQTEGPFYPDKLPLDTDNDLIIINDNISPAVGEITHLSGRILDTSGSPIKNALVEIWQCDANSVYLHTGDSDAKKSQQDKNFQGFGRFLTSSSGEYYFRTIKPVPYPGRPAPHIHFKVKQGGKELLTSQFFIKGYAGNKQDGVFNEIRDIVDRELVLVDFKPVKSSRIGEWSAKFDIVVGRTPDEGAEERRPRRRWAPKPLSSVIGGEGLR